MSYCFNPHCPKPHNPQLDAFCKSCGASLKLITRYRGIRLLGQGGMGKTFLGIDEHLPSYPYCAIKQLYLQDQDPEVAQKAVAMFEQEAVRLEELGKHPQIPIFLANFAYEGQLYLVQEFIEGLTLAEVVKQEGTAKEADIWQILQNLLPVLEFVHRQQVIHRDIKPENILRRQCDRALVLIDFGVARLFTHTALMGGATIVGTPEYMSPEQHRGKVLPASDLYSLGVTCIRLLTGISTLQMYNVMDEEWHWRDFLPQGSPVSYRLGEILDRLVAPSLRQRFQSAREVLDQIGSQSMLRNMTVIQNSLTKLPASPSATELHQQPTKISQPPQTNLEPESEDLTLTEIDIDYSRLKHYLSKKQWEKADDETWLILCYLLGKTSTNYIVSDDLSKIPCEHLQLLDCLWVKSSNNKFGFTVQKEIYREVNGEYSQFCDRVGWTTYRSHSGDTEFQYNTRSPRGHLPSRRWIGGYAWWRHLEVMTETIEKCGFD